MAPPIAKSALMSYRLISNSAPNLRLRPPVDRKEFSNVVDALKKTVQESQGVIDDLGATIDGKSHLGLCNLQMQSFAFIGKLETERVLYDVDWLVKSFQSRRLPLEWFHDAFDLKWRSDDGFITAARAIAELAKLDRAPCTVHDLVFDGRVAEGLGKLLRWGSIKQRWYAAAALTELTKESNPTSERIGRCLGVVEQLVHLLSDAMQCNCGNAKHDAAAALSNLAREPSLVGVFSTSSIVKAVRVVIAMQPQAEDWDTTELLLVTLNSQAWYNQGIAASMYECDFAPVLMTLMKDGAKASRVFRNGVQCEAAYALSRMVDGHSDAAEFFDDDGRMAILTDLLLDEARHPELVRMGVLSVMNALTGLDNLDRAMHYGGVLFKAGVMDACLKLVSPVTSSKLTQNASGAVANMCAVYTDCHEPLIKADGIRIFATLATSSDAPDIEKEHALLVLYHLARCGALSIAQRIATACNGRLLRRLRKQALCTPSEKDTDEKEKDNKRVLREHSVDLMHMLTKRMAEADSHTHNDPPRGRKRARANGGADSGADSEAEL